MIFRRFDSPTLSRRPDQFVSRLNTIVDYLQSQQTSIRIYSADGTQVIIIGEQPISYVSGSATGSSQPFGQYTYSIQGDRLVRV